MSSLNLIKHLLNATGLNVTLMINIIKIFYFHVKSFSFLHEWWSSFTFGVDPRLFFLSNRRSPLSHHLEKWPLFQSLGSGVGFAAHEWSLSSCEVRKGPKWPSSDTCGTERQLWDPLGQMSNVQRLSWPCTWFPHNSCYHFYPDFSVTRTWFHKIHHIHFSLTDRQNTTRNFTECV